MNEIDIVRNKIKNKKSQIVKKNHFGLINKFLVVVLLTIITLILLKSNSNFKETFYKQVYEKTFSFPYIKNLYQKYFGSPVVLEEETKQVFNEALNYNSKEKYKDGVMLLVSKEYVVPSISGGMVVYVGEKEGYGKTVIIEQTDGVEVWYGNVNSSLKMYDYVEKGSSVGLANEKLYLVFKKDGNILNYEDYI